MIKSAETDHACLAVADLVNFSHSDPVIRYFWRAVRSFSHQERVALLQFVTGSSRVPLDGFKGLQGMQCVPASPHLLLLACADVNLLSSTQRHHQVLDPQGHWYRRVAERAHLL